LDVNVNVADFGLLFYNARWYDPALGRFTQADILIPQPGNPASWDRYAYVLNSPVDLADPSGHDPWWCGGDQFCIASHYAQTGYMPNEDQAESDPVKLDTSHKGMAGKIRELYNRYKYFPGWWNEKGKKSLTELDFLKLMLAYEFKGLQDLSSKKIEQLAHGTTHWFNSRCASFTAGGICSGVSPNAIFNFLVASQSTQYRVSDVIDKGMILIRVTDPKGVNLSLAEIIVDSIIYPPDPEWKRGGVNFSDLIPLSHPYTWGNRSLFSIDPPRVVWKWGTGDYFVLLDVEMSHYMENFKIN